MKRGITSAVFGGLRWLSETRDDDKVDFVCKEITNVHNYEDIAGSILLGKVGTPRSSGLSLGGDAVEGEKAAYNIEPTFWNFYKTNGKL